MPFQADQLQVVNNWNKTLRDWKVMYNYIYLTLSINMRNANDPWWSYSFTWVRIFLMKWFLTGNVHSSKWKCTAVWSKTEGKTSNLLASHQLGCWTSWQASPELAGAEIFSTYRLPVPSLKVLSTAGFPRVRDHAVHQWEVSETFFTHTVWWYLFFIPTQNKIVSDLPFSG